MWDIMSILIYLLFEATWSLYQLVTAIYDGYDTLRVNIAWVIVAMLVILCLIPIGLFAPVSALTTGTSALTGLFISFSVVFEIFYISKEFESLPWTYYFWVASTGMFGSIAMIFWFIDDVSISICEGAALYGHGIWHVFISMSIFSVFMARLSGFHDAEKNKPSIFEYTKVEDEPEDPESKESETPTKKQKWCRCRLC